ncbi:MAG: bifunctional phosphoribosylaminoimidazolecarboxamide formyltransferase/IMP cyclohydrolase [Candidatus Omnitrophica bacterium]|nr:bifunctional phosphoribosylaminoimidazolecarboxamide formyltransferase/IMP cyclohydrolase [Candidatus Omnitrophota bacterium]
MIRIRRALISVSDKTGIIDLARSLVKSGVEIISTGGTAKILKEAQIPVREISEWTGFPEILDGRIKTLHPLIYAGILFRRDSEEHVKQVEKMNVKPIDMVVVNLYPFEKTMQKQNATDEEIIENIDIGGPSMLRAASKNYKDVVVVARPEFYPDIISEFEKNNGYISENTSFKMAKEVFKFISYYDWIIAGYLANKEKQEIQVFPDVLGLYFKKIEELRYGENPHQKAAWYINAGSNFPYKQLQGRQLSFNNIIDMEDAYRIVSEFSPPACVIIKHTNPCGVALSESPSQAYEKALQSDPLSAFGGIISFNRTVTGGTAQKIGQTFYEVVIAPDFDEEAKNIFRNKENLRIIKVHGQINQKYVLKGLSKGILIQDEDDLLWSGLKVVTKKSPSEEEMECLKFAWMVSKHVKSNAIVFATKNQTIGIGAGQMSRYDSTRVAVMKMKDNFKETPSPLVMASDAFFPFPDSIDVAYKAGVTAIIQPGGSIKDREVIEACDKSGISMVFTGTRHFKH